MKKLLKVLLALVMAVTLVACGGGESENNEKPNNNETPNTEEKEYTFVYNNTTVKMNEETTDILAGLGKELSYFEAPSCAFEGLDKTYTYPGFQLTTYPKGNADHVNTVTFKDDSVTTSEGVYIGGTKDSVVKAYGENYTENNGAYVYTAGKSQLEFIFTDDTIVSITYKAITQ